ncbi:MAG: pyrroline-5-carboxylate reductase [Alphaproteobacteria bacterium]
MTEIVLVGCGNMGFAMLQGWLSSDPSLSVHVVEPNDDYRQRAAEAGAVAVAGIEDLKADRPMLIILAVKPQAMADVVPPYSVYVETGSTFVSIAAGTTIATLLTLLGKDAPIIRCMPNTPAAIGAGMMVCCRNGSVGEAAVDLTTRLLSASGAVEWLDDEGLMDAVTAVSGSGPAYFFHFVECLADAGAKAGLPHDVALTLAKQTAMGAGRLVAESEDDPAELRKKVTSPGGTTAAALSVFMEDGRLQALVEKAVLAARDRGVELGKG